MYESIYQLCVLVGMSLVIVIMIVIRYSECMRPWNVHVAYPSRSLTHASIKSTQHIYVTHNASKDSLTKEER